MPFSYPVSLELAGRLCVVIGGAKLAEEKIAGLLDAGARVRVVARSPSSGVRELAARGEIEVVARDYAPGDLAGAFLAIAVADDTSVNRRVYEEAEQRRVLMNAVDDVEHCHFAAPAIVRRGDLAVAISTGGKAPALAKQLRQRLDAQLDGEYATLVDVLDEVRRELLPRDVDFGTWARRWQAALQLDLLRMVREGRFDELRAALRDTVSGRAGPSSQTGRVALVGAGPGDPSLITVRGRDLVAQADVIVYDRLVHPSLVQGKRAVHVGKDPTGSSVDQTEINALLVTLAREGNRVVRLKGGDPFVFGRGTEETEALAAAGIEYEVVPAPTSALAALTAAGIPVTDRRHASSVAIVTGHSAGGSSVRWNELASAVDTIVVLMGVANLDRISSTLVASGLEGATPAAVIERATWPDQRVVVGRLDEIAARTRSLGVASPAVVVIGSVVSLRDPTVAGARSRNGLAPPAPGYSSSATSRS